MSAERLAEGYGAYVSADEIAQESTQPADAAVREPTTSIFTTVCVRSTDCPYTD